jgi:hypothetical protein
VPSTTPGIHIGLMEDCAILSRRRGGWFYEGVTQPDGGTEPLLHACRAKVTAQSV